MIRGEMVIRGGPVEWTRRMPKIDRESLKKAAEWWWRYVLPRHFTPRGAIKYGYQPRSAKYLAKKRRVKHHHDPIVWSGETRSMTTKSSRITSKTLSFGSEARVTLKGPKHLYAYRKDYDQPDKAVELTTVAPDESATMTRRHGERVTRALNRVRGVRRVRTT